MRLLTLGALAFLSLATVAPAASADPYYGYYVICFIPNPVGSPGSPVYTVTSAVHDAHHYACFVTDHLGDYLEPVGYAVRCAQYLLTNPPPCP